MALFEDAPVLSERAAALMEKSECVVSIASVWEAAIKVGLGKLNLPYDVRHDLPRIFEENGFQVLPLDLDIVASVKDLEPVHGDPFDRIRSSRHTNSALPSSTGIRFSSATNCAGFGDAGAFRAQLMVERQGLLQEL